MSYLLHLRSFISVYRHNSISRAALALQLTQPAVSRHIKILEAHLQSQLFTRLPRGLAPTPAAIELERQAGPHLDALEAVIGSGAGQRDALAGVVHVGATSGFSRLLLSALSILSRHAIRLDLRAMPPPALVKSLVDRELDVAVTLARIPHKGVDYALLYEGRLQMVCAPTFRDRLPKSAAPKGLPLIDLQGPVPPLASFWREVFGSNAELPSAIVPDYQTALEAAAAGGGLAVMPECLCRPLLHAGQLIALPLPKRAPQFSLYLARGKGGSSVERVDLCCRQLADAARNW
ncbi:DNA-binding transcriptional regulator, LysR family [Collimonas sp. OK307]|uniref:LysR family transcriptional regulator n=1 Tax=Collimonas sp. OK307 TaxID=1801620 RepID=UPI0008EA0E49|nr:LysR family transcriptional regulator [Collimonas sp. OK307]SFI13531.1 DNA-binding transcriptional regulator, LysR family [Collimonas sp. OK307]